MLVLHVFQIFTNLFFIFYFINVLFILFLIFWQSDKHPAILGHPTLGQGLVKWIRSDWASLEVGQKQKKGAAAMYGMINTF